MAQRQKAFRSGDLSDMNWWVSRRSRGEMRQPATCPLARCLSGGTRATPPDEDAENDSEDEAAGEDRPQRHSHFRNEHPNLDTSRVLRDEHHRDHTYDDACYPPWGEHRRLAPSLPRVRAPLRRHGRLRRRRWRCRWLRRRRWRCRWLRRRRLRGRRWRWRWAVRHSTDSFRRPPRPARDSLVSRRRVETHGGVVAPP
jgi:hypothetical protein